MSCGMIASSISTQAEEGENSQDYDDQAYQIDETVHGETPRPNLQRSQCRRLNSTPARRPGSATAQFFGFRTVRSRSRGGHDLLLVPAEVARDGRQLGLQLLRLDLMER